MAIKKIEIKERGAVMNEIKILGKLRNPCIVELLDCFQDKDIMFLVMEYLR